MARAHRTLDLLLPYLRLVSAPVSTALAEQVERGLSKFSRQSARPCFTVTATIACDAGAGDREAAALRARANVFYQFVVGHEAGDAAAYATADGSVAAIDLATGRLDLRLTAAVFDAPYSTWSDLLSAPLASAWRRHGCFPLHAAAVSFDDAAVLVIGESGAGKTTTALALVEGGGSWRADDKILLRQGGGTLEAVSLYVNTNLAPATIDAYPSLRFALERPPINETNDKRPCAMAELDRRVDLRPFAPTALLFVERAAAAESRVRRVSDTDALLRLSAQSPAGAERRALKAQHQQLAAAARALPAWRLEAGRDALDHPHRFASRVREQLAACPA